MSLVRVQIRPACPSRPRPSLLARALGFFALRRSRRRLAELDPHMLRDIGLTAGEARNEADLPFWDAPSHWRR